MPCPHDSFDSNSHATFPPSVPRPQSASPAPLIPPVRSQLPLPDSITLSLCISVLIGSFRIAPFPACSPVSLPHQLPHSRLPSHTTSPLSHRHASQLPYSYWQAGTLRYGIDGVVRNLFCGTGGMALPRPTHAAGLRLSHIKRNPHSPTETALLLCPSPLPVPH